MICHFNSKCKNQAEMVWSELESSKSYYVCIKHFKELLVETPEELTGFGKPNWGAEVTNDSP